MKARALALTVFVVALIACAAIATVQSSAPCPIAWSPPQQLMLGDAHINVDAAQVVATPAGVALLGNNAIALAPSDSGFTPRAGWPRSDRMIAGFMLRPDGRITPIPRPPGIRAFFEVKAASDGKVAHVFWGGSDDTSSSQADHIKSLHYARFDGSEWSEPELLLRDSNLIWHQQLTSVVVSQGQAHLMAIGRDSRRMGELVHVIRDSSGRGSITRPGWPALYAHVTTSGDGNLWLATIEGDHGDRAQMRIRRSTDGGREWSDPVVVYRSGSGTAYEPRIAVTPTGALIAAWIEEPPGHAFTGNGLAFAQSVDSGATWQSLTPVTARGVRDLWILPDGPAAIQIAFHTDDDDGRVAGLRWDAGQWSPRSTFGEPTWFAAQLRAPTKDSLYLVWEEWRTLGPERVPAVVMSRRRSCLE